MLSGEAGVAILTCRAPRHGRRLVATVVGVHFLAFGRPFWIGFYWVGTALIAAGIAEGMVGLVRTACSEISHAAAALREN